MPVVWSDQCRLHEPVAEIFVGARTPATEVSARLDAILVALEGARIVPAEPHADGALLAVHDRALVDYLATAWAEWEAADLGQDRVVPYVFAHEALGARAVPTAVWARPGFFAYDTMTLVGPGTWEAARAAVDVALTAVDLVLAGEPFAYACCRPPGHHATRRCYGGSCYLNNAAVAAAALLERTGGPVAVLDLDAHHGNGTQEVFYEVPDVLVGSVHVDPGAGWFPHFLGFADETGAAAGEGANRNLPLPPGARDEEWLAAVRELVAWAQEARGLVVSLGVDPAAEDPESPLRVSAAGFRDAGRALGSLGLPTILVQEGGYHLATLGALVRETLSGLEEAAR
jgi:acetoin utilization deacetylase AcuC-like enzyme